MKNNTKLIIFIDIKKNMFDFIWISCLGLIAVAAGVSIDQSESKTLFLIKIMVFIAVLASIRYTHNVMGMTRNKTNADFAYSLPVSKTKYYFSKLLSVILLDIATLLIVGIVGGIFTVNSHTWIFAGDIFLIIINSIVMAILITSVMFLSVSVTGKAGTTFLLAAGILIFPMILPFTAEIDCTIYANVGRLGLFTLPNLYLPTNYLIMHMENQVLYFGMFKSILFTFVLSQGYMGIGLYMFCKRDAQTTASYTINKWINYICMSIISLFMVYFTWRYVFKNIYREYYNTYNYYFDIYTAIGLFATALLIMFLYDIVTYGKFRRKNRVIWVFIVIMLICCGTNYMQNERVYKTEKIVIESKDIHHINLQFHRLHPFYGIYEERLTYGGLMAENLEIIDNKMFDDINEYCKNDRDNYLAEGSPYPLLKVTMNDGNYEYVTLSNLEMVQNEMDIMYYGSELLDIYYQCPPVEIVRHVSTNDVELNDSQLKDIYSTYYNEYNNLDWEEKAYHTQKTNERAEPERKTYNFVEMHVVGRIGFETTRDYYRVSKHTPETAYKIFDMCNKLNKDNIINDLVKERKFNTCTIILTDNGDYVAGKGIYDDEQYKALGGVLENNDFDTPKSTDKIAVITYWNNLDYADYLVPYKVFIKIADEEFDALYKLLE